MGVESSNDAVRRFRNKVDMLSSLAKAFVHLTNTMHIKQEVSLMGYKPNDELNHPFSEEAGIKTRKPTEEEQALHDNTPHAKLSASGSPRWINCPGSVRMEEGKPNTSSDAAREGSAAHALLEKCLLEKQYDAAEFLGDLIFIDDIGKNWYVNDEMVRYINEVIEYVGEIVPIELCMAEKTVDFSPWVKGGFGTADIICIYDGVLYVFDLKYGRGHRVEAKNNSQFRLYGLGSINDFEMLEDFDEVRMVVLQPRLHHYDSETMALDDLLEWGHDVVRPAALLTEAPNAPIAPGEEQCLWCTAKATCKPLADFAFTSVIGDFDDLEEAVEVIATDGVDRELTEKEFWVILENITLIEGWCKSMKAHAYSEIESGIDAPNHKLVEGKSNRAIKDEKKTEAFLRRKLGFPIKQVMREQQIKTITGIEKMLDKDQKKLFAKFLHKPKGNPSLVKKSDKRPALVFTKAEDEFDDIDIDEELVHVGKEEVNLDEIESTTGGDTTLPDDDDDFKIVEPVAEVKLDDEDDEEEDDFLN